MPFVQSTTPLCSPTVLILANPLLLKEAPSVKTPRDRGISLAHWVRIHTGVLRGQAGQITKAKEIEVYSTTMLLP